MIPASQRIYCVAISGDSEPHKRIASVGVRHHDGTPKTIQHEEAVAGILKRQWIFTVDVDGKSPVVTLGTGPNGERYLKGFDDGDQPETLLSLPPCC